MGKKWKKIDTILLAAAHIYLLLPIMIFCIGWCKWYIGLAASFAIALGAYLSVRSSMLLEPVGRAIIDRKNFWKYFWKFMVVVLIIVLWAILAGIGGYVWQNDDHLYRNTIFDILVREEWPVRHSLEIDGSVQERGLIYYIGFWLPAGVIGKVFGMRVGYAFQCVWAVLGIVIFYGLICYWRKKVSLWPMLIFIFFSGLDIVGTLCNGEPLRVLWGVEHLERWPGIYQYSSMTTQLFWVFNQAVPAWIACALLFLRPNPQNCVLIWASVMLTSTLPFVGLFPYVAYILLKGDRPMEQYSSVAEYFKGVWKRLAGVPNLVCGGLIGLISFFYLIQNTVGGMLQRIAQFPPVLFMAAGIVLAGIIIELVWLLVHGHARRLKMACLAVAVCGVAGFCFYLLLRGYPFNKIVLRSMQLLWFYLLEAGIYLLLLRKEKSESGFWWLCSISLLIFPLIRVGNSIDFCMRASIPGLILIYFWVVKKFEKGVKTAGAYVLCVVLIAGGITSLHEIARTIVYSSGPYSIESVAQEAVFTGRNFSGETTGIFWKYLAK